MIYVSKIELKPHLTEGRSYEGEQHLYQETKEDGAISTQVRVCLFGDEGKWLFCDINNLIPFSNMLAQAQEPPSARPSFLSLTTEDK